MNRDAAEKFIADCLRIALGNGLTPTDLHFIIDNLAFSTPGSTNRGAPRTPGPEGKGK